MKSEKKMRRSQSAFLGKREQEGIKSTRQLGRNYSEKNIGFKNDRFARVCCFCFNLHFEKPRSLNQRIGNSDFYEQVDVAKFKRGFSNKEYTMAGKTSDSLKKCII
jgi:hypothetical protein